MEPKQGRGIALLSRYPQVAVDYLYYVQYFHFKKACLYLGDMQYSFHVHIECPADEKA